ncbi:uncharacterized protein J3D65DRAFT_287832 [Phyllosticta citribraziliensis]|uniref:Uncharacterized protein n=1 Tax=Phyllosticta citribraziliensis TaxID=989973 RepID=A0ABR1LYE7_9PEZI
MAIRDGYVPASFSGNASISFFQGVKKAYRGRALATIDSQLPVAQRPKAFHNTGAADRFFRKLLEPGRFSLPDFRNLGREEAFAVIYDGLLTELERLGYFRIDSSLVPLTGPSVGSAIYAVMPTIVTLDSATKQLHDNIQRKDQAIQALQHQVKNYENSLSSTSAVIKDLRTAQETSESALREKDNRFEAFVQRKNLAHEASLEGKDQRIQTLESKVSELKQAQSSAFQRGVQHDKSTEESELHVGHKRKNTFTSRREESHYQIKDDYNGNGNRGSNNTCDDSEQPLNQPTGYFSLYEFTKVHGTLESFKHGPSSLTDAEDQQPHSHPSDKRQNAEVSIKTEPKD